MHGHDHENKKASDRICANAITASFVHYISLHRFKSGSMKTPPRLIILGKKNSGKTTMSEWLIARFVARGYRVGAIKKSSHDHPVDKPGSDSDRFRTAGAGPVMFATPEAFALYQSSPESLTYADRERWIAFAFGDCDLVVAESYREMSGYRLGVGIDERDLGDGELLARVESPDGQLHLDQSVPAFVSGDLALIDLLERRLFGR